MNSREKRLEVLRVILSSQGIGRQDYILEELARNGLKVTQATLSRDLNKLRAIKILKPDGYRYVLPETPNYHRTVSVVSSQHGISVHRVLGQPCRHTHPPGLCRRSCIGHRQP